MADSAMRLEEVHAALDVLRERHEGEIPKRELFSLAKSAGMLTVSDIERLLECEGADERVVAVAIMDAQARRKGLDPDVREALFDLYLRRHDRIDSWDLVDRAAPWVLGAHLIDRPRDPLYRLAASERWFERRSAIVATWAFIRRGDLDDTFAIGDLLAYDPHVLVQKAVGGWVREAGKRDLPRLRAYLDRHAATMPRTALRYATEHLDTDERQRYLGLGRA